MQLHRNAKLALRGRRELVLAIERGISLKPAAAGFSESPATAHRWWHRWRAANEQERCSLTCLHDRPSRPRRCPLHAGGARAGADLRVRRRTGAEPIDKLSVDESDREGEVSARLGVERAAQYLVRPDGHIGYRSGGTDLRRLERYLDRWFPRARPEPTRSTHAPTRSHS